jgi:hypothetical protein
MAGGRAALTVRGDDVPVTIPREPGRRAAEEELSDPVYHQDDPGPVERAVDWLGEKLGELLGSAVDVAPGGAVGLAVVLVAVLLLVAALWARLGAPRRSSGARAPSLFVERPRSAAEHRNTAEAHAVAGRWSEAVQERMRALVRSLEERALLDPRPGRTADEAATEAGHALPEHSTALQDAAFTFDEVTYAGRTADQAAYTRMRALDDTVRRAAPRPDGVGSGR